MSHSFRRARLPLLLGLGLATGLAAAQTPPAPASAAAPAASAPAPAAPAAKDIVVDRPATPAARTGRPAQDAATAAALGELALDLLRQQSAASGHAQVNAAVSPLSLAAALGLVHAGTSGIGAQEIAGLLGTRSAGERLFSNRLPQLLDALQQPGSGLLMANRVWLDDGVVKAIPASYVSLVTQRFQADGVSLDFGQAQSARQTINRWAAEKTAQRIPELLPAGALTPNTRAVLTNALHFKSPWDKPFDVSKTASKPFQLAPGAQKLVPTMSDEREVRMGVVEGVSVMELPFAGSRFSLVLAMPQEGHTLNALETDLEGVDLAGWQAQLKPRLCRVELPKFTIAPKAQSLKAGLQALGMKTVFGRDADLSPMLGRAAKGVYLDNVFQSVSVSIDEQGGEAAAASGATVLAKSFTPPAPACAIDRPFVFAIVHKPSGAPLFVGKVADPTLP